MKSGIYKIVNIQNGKFYIGSSNNIERRFIEHRYHLNKQSHRNRHLQFAWNKYGSSSFSFEVLELIDTSRLALKEQEYIDLYNPEYNLARNTIAPCRGTSRSKESRDKIRNSLLAKKNKGYTYLAKRNRYSVKIRINGRFKYIGLFKTPEEARAAYNIAVGNLN